MRNDSANLTLDFLRGRLPAIAPPAKKAEEVSGAVGAKSDGHHDEPSRQRAEARAGDNSGCSSIGRGHDSAGAGAGDDRRQDGEGDGRWSCG